MAARRKWRQGEKDFIHGLAVGLAIIARDRDEPSLAADAMSGCGYDAADLRAAGVDPYDLAPLRKALRDNTPWSPQPSTRKP